MTRQEMLLTILAEECVETAQRATKALRFGLEEVQVDQNLTNAERIIYEFNDILAVMYILRSEGFLIDDPINHDMIELKQLKVKKYLEHSLKCGTLTI